MRIAVDLSGMIIAPGQAERGAPDFYPNNRKRESCTSGSVRDEVATSSSTRRLGSAAAWPAVAQAQQPAIPVIGFLSSQSAELDYKVTVAFCLHVTLRARLKPLELNVAALGATSISIKRHAACASERAAPSFMSNSSRSTPGSAVYVEFRSVRPACTLRIKNAELQ
jgi:hypothetical protein